MTLSVVSHTDSPVAALFMIQIHRLQLPHFEEAPRSPSPKVPGSLGVRSKRETNLVGGVSRLCP
jgi:hypothetical protein